MEPFRKIRKMQNSCSQFANEQYVASYDEIDKKYAAYLTHWQIETDLRLWITINKLDTYRIR